MATRKHLCVAVLSISTVTTGCIFGGGGDKKKAQAVKPPAQPAPAHAEVIARSQPPQPQTAQQQALASQRPERRDGASRAAAAAPVAELPPRDSVVQWSQDELWLNERAPARPAVPQPEPYEAPARPPAPVSVMPPQSAAVARRDQSTEIVLPDVSEVMPEAAAAGAASSETVANRPLELTQPSPVAPAAAATPGTDAAAQIASAAVTPRAANASLPDDVAAFAASDDLARRVAQQLRQNPGDLASHLDHQLYRFISDESVPDLASISTLPAEDREVLTAVLDGLTNFRNGLRGDSNMLLSRKVRPLIEMASRLRSQADLSIPTIALSNRIVGFGNYSVMDNRFLAGRPNAAIIYCEVANVASQQNEQGVWESKLSQESALYKEENGQLVWSTTREVSKDVSRNRRHDFYVLQKVEFPATLSIDRYILKVTVTDEQVKRVAEATMPIQIVASLPQSPSQVQPPASPVRPVQAPPQQLRQQQQPNPARPQPAAPGSSGGTPDRSAPDARTAAGRQRAVDGGLSESLDFGRNAQTADGK